MRARRTRRLHILGVALGLVVATTAAGAAESDPTKPAATPGIACDEGSLPETGMQGDIPQSDLDDNAPNERWRKGYTCNTRLVSHIGSGGGYRVERYVDGSGHECAYFDSGTLFPNTVHADGSGVVVADMSNRSKPRIATTLVTPAMLTPHESLRLNQRRGLLVAVAGNPAAYPGVMDVYSVKENCLQPQLLSSTPLGVLGHESAFSPDGRTFYSNSNMAQMTVIGLEDPTSPQLLWNGFDWAPHGASVSTDGNTMFVAGGWDGGRGLVVLDVSDINRRVPDPQIRELSHITWPELAIPQNATPFRSHGHDYVIETDEFGGGSDPVGAARIINVDNLKAPYVVSHLRLQIHNHNTTGTERSAHYCTVPSRIDPTIVACSMLYSGLRVFDIGDVAHPVEAAYANFTQDKFSDYRVGNAYSAPAYDPETNDVWYADANRGLFVTHLTDGSGIKRFAREYGLPGS
jgi:hypothetical protein